uniref:Zinc finger, CCHC-type n=1 Tax=Tanacetum cinerariifolium TaxID=118510 RepID=A0A6L2ND29_TANCI|nr:zinc finger, CCHC-type [Tanacetum cinerariifolium]
MAEEDAFIIGDVEGGLCVDNTDAGINGRFNSELWDSLKSKYMAEDSSSKKFLVSNFNNYKMVDSRPVMELYKELLRILGQYTQHGLKMDESISISSIINKLPPSWKDFKHTLKHGKDDLSLVQLGSHFRIEESLRAQDSDEGKGKEVCGPFVNMIEEARLVTSKGIAVVVKRTQMLVVSKRGLRTNPKTKVDAIAWWIDSGAITHVCKDRCWFKTFEPVKDGSVLYMVDEHFAPVYGKGSVALEFSSGKTVTLFNGLYVPKLRKNLVSGPVLNKCGYKQVYESDKYILSKCGVFVGFGYYNNGHVHYKRMLEMSKDELIHTIDENPDKCTTCNKRNHLKTTAPYTPQQNDLAKTKSRALKEMVNSMLSYSGLSEGFWGEAMLTACYLLNKVSNKRNKTTPYELCIEEDPRSYNEAMQFRDAAFWKEAINDEIGSINNTWVLSDLPPGCKPLGCKWIFKRKMKVDGTINKFKARLVIKGFRQKEGIDYFDTHTQVSCIATIRLLLALAAIHNLVIHQMDVKIAFLNGDLDEEVYMKKPEGFVMPGNKHKVCKLVKSLYGLKQATKQWHQKFDEVVLSSGFHLNQSDKCVYRKFDNSGKGVIICLYVDEMLIFGIDQNQVDETKKFLSSRFSMKDIGEADVILDCSSVSTPMDPIKKLKPNTGKPVDQLEYSRAIGFLIYAMTSTRPDIAYAVGRLSRFTSNPSSQHWKAKTRASKKKTCITSSTIESEFVALAATSKEAKWLRNLIHEIPIWLKPIEPISIRCDSAPTMARAYSQIYNKKSRHLGVRHSMVRELIMNGMISIEFFQTQHNLADHLTMGLVRDLVNKSVKGI